VQNNQKKRQNNGYLRNTKAQAASGLTHTHTSVFLLVCFNQCIISDEVFWAVIRAINILDARGCAVIL